MYSGKSSLKQRSGAGAHLQQEAMLFRAIQRQHTSLVQDLTILGFAGSVIRLQEVSFNTAARVGTLCVGAGLAAGPIDSALIEVSKRRQKNKVWTSIFP